MTEDGALCSIVDGLVIAEFDWCGAIGYGTRSSPIIYYYFYMFLCRGGVAFSMNDLREK